MLEIKEQLLEILKSSAVISLFAGAVTYFYKVYKGEDFVLWRFLMNLVFAFFVGYVAGKFIPADVSSGFRDGLTAISGFLAFPILDIIEQKGVSVLLKKLNIEL